MKLLLATAALVLIAAAAGHAYSYGHENILTFSRPVALPGVVLPAGTYSFDIASPMTLDVVVVRNPKTAKVYYMGFTNTVTRPRTMSKEAPITFGGAPANEPKPIAAWWEIGNTSGHQFLYR
jgi:hypothetical protein